MSTKRRDLTTIIAIGIILGALVASQAKAEIRVNARVRVPGGVIQVNNHRCGHDGPAHRVVAREITRHDRKVARRLARYTGERKRAILNLRRLGYRWNEIGTWLGVSRKAVRAAQSAEAWGRYMRRIKRLGHDRMPAHPEPNRRSSIDDRACRR